MVLMKNQRCIEVNDVKITKILPRFLAVGFQEYDLSRSEGLLDYHRSFVAALEEHVAEGRDELARLTEKRR